MYGRDDDHDNEHADYDDERDDIFNRVSEMLVDVLDEDEEVVFRREGDEVFAETSYARFVREHPKLYGRLASINEQLDQTWATNCIANVVAVLIAVGLYVGWFDAWLTEEIAEKLRSWWVYLLIVVGGLVLSGFLNMMRESWVYATNRKELLHILSEEDLDRDTVIPLLEDEAELERVLRRLKLDTGPFR